MEGRFFKDNLSVLGDVGVGTVNPLYKLDVVETGSVASARIRSTNANVARLFLSNTVGTWRLYSAAASNSFRIFSDSLNDDAFVIKSDGNVGIGTGTPSQGLHVQGNLRVTGAYYASDNNAGSSNQVLTSTGSGGTDWKSLSQIGGVTGSGTSNKLPLWDGTSSLTDSIITQSSTSYVTVF